VSGEAPDVVVDVDITDPGIPAVMVRLANAHHGARWPGDLVTLAADLARVLCAEGMATREEGPQSPYLP
jgi:hypothetical protein